ncbi:MAG: DUF2188 domain-containing protein [Betaproteobacteria bacterium]
MNKNKRIHGVPDDAQWKVKREGFQRASSVHNTKADAVASGRSLAQADKGRLLIHKQDGRIQEERTFRNDPYPPKG